MGISFSCRGTTERRSNSSLSAKRSSCQTNSWFTVTKRAACFAGPEDASKLGEGEARVWGNLVFVVYKKYNICPSARKATWGPFRGPAPKQCTHRALKYETEREKYARENTRKRDTSSKLHHTFVRVYFLVPLKRAHTYGLKKCVSSPSRSFRRL